MKTNKTKKHYTLLDDLKEIQSWNTSDIRSIDDISPNLEMLLARRSVIRGAIRKVKTK